MTSSLIPWKCFQPKFSLGGIVLEMSTGLQVVPMSSSIVRKMLGYQKGRHTSNNELLHRVVASPRTSNDPRTYPTSLNPLPPPASPLPHVYTRTSVHLPSLCDKTSLLFPISPLTTRQQSSTAHQRVTSYHRRQDVLHGENRSLELSRDQIQKCCVPIEKVGGLCIRYLFLARC